MEVQMVGDLDTNAQKYYGMHQKLLLLMVVTVLEAGGRRKMLGFTFIFW